MAEGNCPECGVSMKTRDPTKHCISHWGENFDVVAKANAEARKRMQQLGVKV